MTLTTPIKASLAGGRVTLREGDCLKFLRRLPDNSVHSIVTDPPYGLSKEPDMIEVLRHWLSGDDYQHRGAGFMGKSWDSFVPGPAIWRECYRILKPGGHMAVFGGTRTFDLMVTAIRIGGFEIRDQLAWIYGSGWPKGVNVSKAIDKLAGAEREVIGPGINHAAKVKHGGTWTGKVYAQDAYTGAEGPMVTAPATPEAAEWEGWNTALKPAFEPICLARKPLIGTVPENVLEHGCGAMNVDACRVGTESTRRINTAEMGYHGGNVAKEYQTGSDQGRYPANVIHDGSPEAIAGFPVTGKSSGGGGLKTRAQNTVHTHGSYGDRVLPDVLGFGDSGSAARYFYSAKASKHDRGDSEHPTIKPVNLMRWLTRLVTRPGGIVVDPFSGSGTTALAAHLEGFYAIAFEQDPQYCRDIVSRFEALEAA